MELIVCDPVLQFGMDGSGYLTLKVDAESKGAARTVVNELSGHKLTATIDRWREKRSLSANAYFHVLCDKIAKAQRLGADEVKRALVCDYGAQATDEDGGLAGVMIPAKQEISSFYPYAKWFDTREIGGTTFDCYILYKQTHTLDTAEMSRLIDGAIQEAKQLGIETLTPAQYARMMEDWHDKEVKKSKGV